jgi:hypothetical protein
MMRIFTQFTLIYQELKAEHEGQTLTMNFIYETGEQDRSVNGDR